MGSAHCGSPWTVCGSVGQQVPKKQHCQVYWGEDQARNHKLLLIAINTRHIGATNAAIVPPRQTHSCGTTHQNRASASVLRSGGKSHFFAKRKSLKNNISSRSHYSTTTLSRAHIRPEVQHSQAQGSTRLGWEPHWDRGPKLTFMPAHEATKSGVLSPHRSTAVVNSLMN